jgi:hypothetical protein
MLSLSRTAALDAAADGTRKCNRRHLPGNDKRLQQRCVLWRCETAGTISRPLAITAGCKVMAHRSVHTPGKGEPAPEASIIRCCDFAFLAISRAGEPDKRCVVRGPLAALRAAHTPPSRSRHGDDCY